MQVAQLEVRGHQFNFYSYSWVKGNRYRYLPDFGDVEACWGILVLAVYCCVLEEYQYPLWVPPVLQEACIGWGKGGLHS